MATAVTSLPSSRLGRSGLEVSSLGLGGAGLGGVYGEVSETEAIEAVHKALELGITYLDTSPKYGDSERRIGLALQDLRERVVLSSKTGTHPDFRGYTANLTYRSVENSLRQLRTNWLDIVLIHDPEPDQFQQTLGKGGALEALEDLKNQGVIRAIGLGVRDLNLHLQAIDTGRFDVLLTFLEYTLLRTRASEELLPEAKAQDIGMINGSPLAMGLLSGANPRQYFQQTLTWAGEEWPEVETAQRLWQWAEEGGHDLAAYALQFSSREPRIHSTLVGAKTALQVEQSVRAAQLHTTAWEELERVRKESV